MADPATVLDDLITGPLGLAHFLAALGATALGTAVLFGRKGTRRHRRLGRGYLLLMLVLNGTGLIDYALSGAFGIFHWMALASLSVILVGYLAARRRALGWMSRHAYFMIGSYVGLLAAGVAQAASRIPTWPPHRSVLAAALLVTVVGVGWMLIGVPRILDRGRADGSAGARR